MIMKDCAVCGKEINGKIYTDVVEFEGQFIRCPNCEICYYKSALDNISTRQIAINHYRSLLHDKRKLEKKLNLACKDLIKRVIANEL